MGNIESGARTLYHGAESVVTDCLTVAARIRPKICHSVAPVCVAGGRPLTPGPLSHKAEERTRTG